MEITDVDVLRHQAWLAQQINNNRTGERTTCDLTLVSEEHEFQVHKAVLMVVSKYFEKMFTIEMKEKYSDRVEIKQIPHQRLKNIIEFVYGGIIDVTEENVSDILNDAEYLELQVLKSQCIKYLCEVVSAENVLKFRRYAQQYELGEVLTKTNEAILSNFAKVIQLEDFMQLDFDDMSDVINQRNKGCARSEVACFNGIVGWVNHCPLQRKELFVKLFSEVDLSSTNMSFLEMASQENLVKNNLLCANFLVQGSLMFIQRMSTSTFLLIGGTTEHEAVVYNIMSKETTQFPDLNIGRMKATSAKVGKRVFVIGGIAAGKTLLKSCEMLDLDQPDKWIVLPDMIQARHLCGSGLIAGQIYVTGGMNTYHLSSCEKFDIQANVWTRTENMLQKRCSHGCVVCNGLLYCIGGKKGTEHISSCECYDVESKKWKEIAPLNEPRRSMASVVLDGTIFAIGGIGHNKQTLSTVERYFPERNTWEYVAPLLLSCSRASACVLGTRLYVIGGSSGVASLKTVQQYDPDSDSWTICFEMKKATSSTTVVVV